MNASEIHDMVSQWPDEARPGAYPVYTPDARSVCGYGVLGTPAWFLDDCEYAIDPSTAAALHVASGLEWLARNAFAPLIRIVAGEFEVKARGTHTAPTLIEAVSAAIMAVKGGAA